MAHTLLLGLGGTGSRVAVKVAKELEKQSIKINDGVVCCAVMDTDENDMAKLMKEVGVETAIPVVATSSAETVGDILKNYPEAKSWCIDNCNEFLSETTTNGASTMRMKSRLAFLNTYNNTKIRTIENLISKMMETGTGNDDIRVMLISSISGGTGAGMFLQTALWIRNKFKERGREIKLRGMLLLPDVFVKTIKDVQNNDFLEDRHYANAYAAIREMNAIAKIKDTNGYKPKVPLKIDGLFDSEDLDNPGRSKKGLFDFIFFIDYENKAGVNLRAISAYEDIVAQLAYTHSFSPMADSINTKEDNVFLAHILQGFSFGSCGTAKAIYPKDDVVEYCILRTVREMISDGWCNLDAEINAAQTDIESRRKAGEDVAKLDCVKKYIELCESKMKTKNPFFSSMQKEVSAEKVNKFVKNLEKYIQTQIDDINDEIEEGEAGLSALVALGAPLDAEREKREKTSNQNALEYEAPLIKVSIGGNSEGEVGANVGETTYDKVEDLVKLINDNAQVFADSIEKFNTEQKDEIAGRIINEIFPRIMSELDMHNGKSVYGMLTYQNDKNERTFVHPVAMRYLLYKLKKEVEKSLGVQKFELENVVGRLNILESEVDFNYPGTSRRETLEDYFDYYNRIHFWEGGKESFKKHFKEQYKLYIPKQYSCGKEYETKAVYVAVLQELNGRVEKLIEKLDDFFKQLPEIVTDCDEKLKKNLDKSLQRTNTMYVCASKEAKDQVYRSLDISFDGSDRTTNRIVIDAVYGMYCAEAIAEHPSNEKYVDFDIKDAFRNGVESFYTEKILKTKGKEIDMDIYTALKTEMRSEGDKHYDQKMSELIAEIEHKASPYLHYVDNKQDQITYKFWGFHPNLSAAYSDIGTCIGGNAESQTSELFPKNEIICYSTVYNVDVQHFLKFSEDKNSDYYTEYCAIVSKMNDSDPRTLMQTPHLDKTWHNLLQYLSDDKQRMEDKRLYRGILYGFAYNRLRLNGDGVYQILRGENEWGKLGEGDDLVKKAEVADLFRLLMKDGLFIRKDITFLENEFAKETQELSNYVGTKIYQYFVSKDDVNPIKLITSYNNASATCNATIRNGLIKAIEDIVMDLINAYDRTHTSRSTSEKTKVQSVLLGEIYKSCGDYKGKEDTFISWVNNFGINSSKTEENACENPSGTI
ncbi:MAG: hypothetical protein E7603_08595 [Ruminococcaceae bacterium]|nr:hypothetical protein [Oscillospiraceae bacterium]